FGFAKSLRGINLLRPQSRPWRDPVRAVLGSQRGTDTNRLGRKVSTLPRKVLTGVIVQVKKRFKQLKSRYGPRYTKAMAGAAFVAFFAPLPGSVLIAVALIVVIAEIHR